MASLLEILDGLLTPDVVESIGQALELERGTASAGLQAVAPLVQHGLARQAATAEGLARLVETMPAVMEEIGKGDISVLLSSLAHTGGNQDMMTSLMGMLTGAAVGSRASTNAMVQGLLDTLFGHGLGAVGGTVDRALGIQASPLLAAAAPLLMGVLGNTAHAQGLDAGGMAALLQAEDARFFASGDRRVALVAAAMQAGDEAAALQRKFTPEAWTQVRMAPLAAGAMVMAAAPSRAIGTSQEIEAMVAGVESVKAAAMPTSLLSVAFDGAITPDELKRVTGQQPKEALLATIRAALAAVAAQDESALAGYKVLVRQVAEQVAGAAREGGFFGIGGRQVNEAEKETLRELQALLM